VIKADHGIESTFYEFIITDESTDISQDYKFIIDMRDLYAYDLEAITGEGITITELLSSDAVVYEDLAFDESVRARFGSPFDPGEYHVRMSNVYQDGWYSDTPDYEHSTKNFNLKVEAWAYNCCDTPVMKLAEAEENVTLEPKVIDEGTITP